ncbi:MAG: hypothetical protein R3B13_08525 [Polyangiaceae bacterium]
MLRFGISWVGRRLTVAGIPLIAACGGASTGAPVNTPPPVERAAPRLDAPAAPPAAPVERRALCGQEVPVNSERFSCNQLDFTDLTSLEGMSQLRELVLASSGVSDLRPLATLPRLEALDLESTDVTDLSPLTALPNLTRLRVVFRTTMVTEHPRVLTALNRPIPKIDLSPLAQLPKLERLSLGFVAVDSLEPLSQVKELRRLMLVSVDAPAGALRGMAGLEKLEQVVLMASPCRELDVLASSRQMRMLFIHGCRRADLRPLAHLTGLQRVTLSSVEGRGARELSNLKTVKALDASQSRLDDYSFLSAMTKLESLDLSGSSLTNAAPLASLSQLRSVDLSGTKVIRLEPLKGLAHLQRLVLSGDPSHAFNQPTTPDPKLRVQVERLRRVRPTLKFEYRSDQPNEIAQLPAIFDD